MMAKHSNAVSLYTQIDADVMAWTCVH